MTCECFRLKSEMDALAPFNAQVRDRLAAGPYPPDEATAATIFLLLDELLTNVIKYGHPDGGAAHVIDVRICLEARGFVIDLEDDGLPFDPTVAPAPAAADEVPWEDRPVGGWGLKLVRQSVDAVEYRRDQSKNKLTLRKHFGRNADAPVP